MQTDVDTVTYVVGRSDGLVRELRALTEWVIHDAAQKSARGRVVFLGGVVCGHDTHLMMDVVYELFDRLPGSTIIRGDQEQRLLDFLEADLNPAPIKRWMDHGGRAIVESFGVAPSVRRSAEIRRIVTTASPRLLEAMQGAPEFEIEGDYCFTDGWTWPKPGILGSEVTTPGYDRDEVTSWHEVSGKIVVHDRSPSNDCFPEVEDRFIRLGGFPSQTGRIQLLAIENGRATRFAFAESVQLGDVSITVRPAEIFLKAPLGAARFETLPPEPEGAAPILQGRL